MNGIVIVDKPAGWTSQDVTAKLRGVFQTRRIGHGGTLDPLATGVLPVFVGRATRAVPFFEHADKTYIATLRLGITTDTQDITGAVLHTAPVSVTPERLEQVFSRFRGEISQLPPMYSALKVNGQKLCDLARKGKQVARTPRPVTVYELTRLSFDGTDVVFRVHCSKGTYVRTLCEDMGNALGCGGCMTALRRIRAGAYTEADAVSMETLTDASDPGAYLSGTDTMFARYPAITLSAAQETRCRNGNAFSVSLPDGTYRAYGESGEFLMVAKAENGTLSTVKSFFEV